MSELSTAIMLAGAVVLILCSSFNPKTEQKTTFFFFLKIRLVLLRGVATAPIPLVPPAGFQFPFFSSHLSLQAW